MLRQQIIGLQITQGGKSMKHRISHQRSIGILLIISIIHLFPVQAMAIPAFQQDSLNIQADTLYQQGDLLTQNSEWQAALTKFEAALRLYQQVGARPKEALCLHQIGFLNAMVSDYMSALNAYQASLAISQEIDYHDLEAVTLSNMGTLYSYLGSFQEALTTLQKALTIQESLNDPRRGSTLDKIGGVYAAQGQYENALAAHQQAIEILREVDDQEGVGTVLQNIGFVYGQLGQYEVALATYLQALEILRNANKPFGEAAVLNNIGGVYDQLGRYEEALDAYQASLEIRQAIGDLIGQGDTLHQIALYYDRLGQYKRSLTIYQQALAIHQTVENRSGEGATLNNIGGVYKSLGQYEASLTNLQEALAIRREIGDQAGEGDTLNHLGDVYSERGQYADALSTYQQALAIHRQIGHRVSEGDSLDHIGLTYHYQGWYEQALAILLQALEIRRDIGDQAGESSTLSNIGLVYNHLGQHEDALDAYRQALTIQEVIGAQGRVARTLSTMGVDYQVLGRYEEALEVYQRALGIQANIGDRAGQNSTLNNIGTIYISQGEYEKALETYRQLLVVEQAIDDLLGEGAAFHNIGFIYAAQGEDEDALAALQKALAIRQEIGDRSGEVDTLGNIGYLYESQQNSNQAILAYQEAITVTESIQDAINVEELKASFVSGHIGIYMRLINLLWIERQPKQAFAYTERAKAQAFLDQLGNQPVDFHKGAAQALLQRERTLRQQITGLQNALATERSKPDNQQDQELLTTLSNDLESARKGYAQLLTRLKLANPEYASLVSVSALSLEEIQQQVLDDQTTLIEYFVLNEHILAWVVDQKSFELVSLNIPRTDLTNQIEFMRNLITERDFDADTAADIYNRLFAPLRPHIRHANLIIVPHGVLHYLPFAALWDAENKRYLVDEYVITYAPSASVLKFIHDKRNPNEGRLLALGNPDQTLGNATTEIRNIAQLYNAIPLLSSQATESQIHQQASQTDILHLAAHGVYDPFNPLFTRIELAADEEKRYDGNLEVHEVYSMDLTNANLVVLSACETALGEQSAGDEIVGLTRAFLYAGAPSVITSLWNVDDESTAYLMTQFYTHYRGGMGVAAALRQAQFDTMVEYPEPYYWAAFTLHGDGGWEDLSAPTVDGSTARLELLRQEAPFRYWLYVTLQQLEIK